MIQHLNKHIIPADHALEHAVYLRGEIGDRVSVRLFPGHDDLGTFDDVMVAERHRQAVITAMRRAVREVAAA